MRIAVDWDGTCVENKFPGMGGWLPGAVDALRALSADHDVLIFSCRTRWPGETDRVRAMLDAEGLHAVRVHGRAWKPLADAYVDDKAVRFTSWAETLPAIHATN